MKTQLKAQLLQHLASKKSKTEGFTLIELLVVIIIIGILSAIALPAFLNQANRARQSEAVTYVGSVNRAQQAYRLENRSFAPSIPLLGLGIQTDTEFYAYSLADINTSGATVTATPTDDVLLGYAGRTYITQDTGGNATTTAILCTGTPNVVPAITPGTDTCP